MSYVLSFCLLSQPVVPQSVLAMIMSYNHIDYVMAMIKHLKTQNVYFAFERISVLSILAKEMY